jgi:hypothetical protein
MIAHSRLVKLLVYFMFGIFLLLSEDAKWILSVLLDLGNLQHGFEHRVGIQTN